jgi:hypothetical protein
LKNGRMAKLSSVKSEESTRQKESREIIYN